MSADHQSPGWATRLRQPESRSTRSSGPGVHAPGHVPLPCPAPDSISAPPWIRAASGTRYDRSMWREGCRHVQRADLKVLTAPVPSPSGRPQRLPRLGAFPDLTPPGKRGSAVTAEVRKWTGQKGRVLVTTAALRVRGESRLLFEVDTFVGWGGAVTRRGNRLRSSGRQRDMCRVPNHVPRLMAWFRYLEGHK